MPIYMFESMEEYLDAKEQFIKMNGRPLSDLDKAILQNEVLLRLVLRQDERLAHIEQTLEDMRRWTLAHS